MLLYHLVIVMLLHGSLRSLIWTECSVTLCSRDISTSNRSDVVYTCVSGHYVDLAGQSNQLECESGTYQSGDGQTSCVTANPGYYVSSKGSTMQTPCPSELTTQNPSSTAYQIVVKQARIPRARGQSTQTPCSGNIPTKYRSIQLY